MPEEFLELDPVSRTYKIVQKSLIMMLCGTVVVLLFSDPMVDVLGRVGELTNIPAF